MDSTSINLSVMRPIKVKRGIRNWRWWKRWEERIDQIRSITRGEICQKIEGRILWVVADDVAEYSICQTKVRKSRFLLLQLKQTQHKWLTLSYGGAIDIHEVTINLIRLRILLTIGRMVWPFVPSFTRNKEFSQFTLTFIFEFPSHGALCSLLTNNPIFLQFYRFVPDKIPMHELKNVTKEDKIHNLKLAFRVRIFPRIHPLISFF